MIPDDTLAEWEHLAQGFRGTILGNAALEMAKEIRRLREEREVMFNHPPLYRYDANTNKLELLACMNCAAQERSP